MPRGRFNASTACWTRKRRGLTRGSMSSLWTCLVALELEGNLATTNTPPPSPINLNVELDICDWFSHWHIYIYIYLELILGKSKFFSQFCGYIGRHILAQTSGGVITAQRGAVCSSCEGLQRWAMGLWYDGQQGLLLASLQAHVETGFDRNWRFVRCLRISSSSEPQRSVDQILHLCLPYHFQ